VNGDPLRFQHTEQSVVLLLHKSRIRRLVAFPVPTLLGIDERLHRGIPGVRPYSLQFRARSAHQDRPQSPYFAVRSPAGTPDALALLDALERRLGKGREEALVIRIRQDVAGVCGIAPRHRWKIGSRTHLKRLLVTEPYSGV